MTETARRLATIVALDVAGYSARTEADEARLDTGDEATARRQIAIARSSGVPLARLEAIASRFYPAGADADQWLANLRRLWAEAEPGA